MGKKRRSRSSFFLASLSLFSTNTCGASFIPVASPGSLRNGCTSSSRAPLPCPVTNFPSAFKPTSDTTVRHVNSYRIRVRLQSTNSDEESPTSMALASTSQSERALGLLVLLTVPLSWGTYGPVVRYLYEIQPPVPGFVFSAAYSMVASLSLLALASMQAEQIDSDEPQGNQTAFPVLGGVELGTYLFIGNCLQVIGLKTVPSDRAGFLVQLTTVMVPLVQAFLAGDILAIPLLTWAACLLAFGGVLVMGLDGKDVSLDNGALASFSSAVDFSSGDLLIIMAAFVYTMHVVRLSKYARETTPLKLAASKAAVEAILSVGLVAGLIAAGDSFSSYGTEITTFFSTISQDIASGAVPTSVLLPALGAVLWTGWITSAYTIYAQSFGQRRVNPTDANLIYTVQPIFTALFAWVLLGETLGPTGIAGGALIGAAVYLVAMMESKDNDSSLKEQSLEAELERADTLPSRELEEIGS